MNALATVAQFSQQEIAVLEPVGGGEVRELSDWNVVFPKVTVRRRSVSG